MNDVKLELMVLHIQWHLNDGSCTEVAKRWQINFKSFRVYFCSIYFIILILKFYLTFHTAFIQYFSITFSSGLEDVFVKLV